MEAEQAKILIQAYAINAEIEAMKAENSIRLINDNQISYSEQDFMDKAAELIELSRDMSS